MIITYGRNEAEHERHRSISESVVIGQGEPVHHIIPSCKDIVYGKVYSVFLSFVLPDGACHGDVKPYIRPHTAGIMVSIIRNQLP